VADTPVAPDLVWMQGPTGGPVGVPQPLVQQYLSQNYQMLPADAGQKIDLANRHRGVAEMLKTFGEGAVGTLAPVVGPGLLELLGDTDQLGRRQAHPWIHGAGALAGAVAPLLISGGGSAAAKGVVEGAEAAATPVAATLGRVGAEGAQTVKAAEGLGAAAAPVAGAAGRVAPAVPEAAGAVGQVMREPAMPFPRVGMAEAPPAAATLPGMPLPAPAGAVASPLPAVPAAAAPAVPGAMSGAARGAADASFPSVVARLGERAKAGVLGTDGMTAAEAVLYRASLPPAQRIASEVADQVVQGAMYAGFDGLNRAVIGDPEATAEHIMAEGLFGGLIGGGFGVGMGALGEITKGYAKNLVPVLRDWEAERAMKAAKGIQSDINRVRKGISEERFKKIALYWSEKGFVGGMQGIDTMDAKATVALKKALDDMDAIKSAAGLMENPTTISDLTGTIRGLKSYESLKHNPSQKSAFSQIEDILKNYESEERYGIWGLRDIEAVGVGEAGNAEVGVTPQPVEVLPLMTAPNNRGFVQTIEPGAGAMNRMPHIATPQRPHEPVQYGLVKLDDLIQSHDEQTFRPNPKYPKKARIQDRDRGDLGHKEQVLTAVKPQNWDPSQLIDTASSPMTGAPIVTSGDEMIVLGGNGRTMMMKLARKNPETWAAYKEYLAAQAPNFGFTAEQVMSDPDLVLVRIAPHLPNNAPAADLAAAGTRYNISNSKQLSPILNAVADAKNLSPETVQGLSDILSSAGTDAKGNPRTLRQLMDDQPEAFVDLFRRDGIITQSNVDTWHVKGRLLPEKKDYIEAMFLGRVMGTGERILGAPPKVLRNVEAIAPYLLKIAGANPASNEIGTVQRAVDLLSDAAQRKITVEDLVAQRGLAGIGEQHDPALLPLAQMLRDKGTKQIQEPFKAWAAKANFDPGQSTMFAPNPTAGEVRESLFGKGDWAAPQPEKAAPVAAIPEPHPAAPPGAPPPQPTAPQERPDLRAPRSQERWVGEFPTGFDPEAQEIVRLGDKPLSIEDIHVIRQQIRDRSRGWQGKGDPTIRAFNDVMDDGRFAISERLDSDLEALGLGSADWRDANFRYQAMRILRDFLDAGSRRGVGNNQLTVMGGLGAITGFVTGHVPMGFAGAATAEFLKRRGSALQVSMLRAASDAIEGVEARSAMTIQQKVKTIFTGGGAAATASAMGSIMASRPTDDQVNEAMANIGAAANDPNRTAYGVERGAGALIPLAAPSAAHLGGKAKSGAGFLQDKLPGPMHQSPLAPKHVPSPTEIHQFRTPLHVMNDPFTVLDHIAVGMLTPAHVEALDATYPKLANAMRLEVGAALADSIARGTTVPRVTRQSMGLFLGADLDGSMAPGMLAGVQGLHASQQKPMGPGDAHPAGSGRPRKIDLHLSSSYRTETQGREERLGGDSLA
jgi:hypothetical protein